MDQVQSVDVCIVGAGPVGGALAARLAGAGIGTALIDRAALPPMAHPDFDGRAYAIAAGSRRVLEEAGLWRHLPYRPNPIRRIRVSDGKIGRPASRLHLHFDVEDVADQATPFDGEPAFGWMVEARSLRMALNSHLHALPALSVFAPAEAQVVREADGATVRIAGGPTLRARLVVAAEGRRSPLREAAGIRVTHLPYHQTGMVFAIAHEHHMTTWRWSISCPAGRSRNCRWPQPRGRRMSRPSCGPSAMRWPGISSGWTMPASPAKWRAGSAITWGRCG